MTAPANLADLLAALGAAPDALVKDKSGDLVIVGSRGAISVRGGKYMIFTNAQSRRHWQFLKAALSPFCKTIEVGVFRLDNVPQKHDIERFCKLIGLAQLAEAAA